MRRFALAIRRESVAGSGRLITLATHDWSWIASPVLLATSWRERLLGVDGAHRRVLLPVSYVHGRGLAGSLHVIGLDGVGRVIEARRLDPGGFLRIPGAKWVLELPVGDTLPPASGAVVSLYPHADARQIDAVRYSYRQPQ